MLLYIHQSKIFLKVFGHKPCVMYLNLRSSEFVATFMPMLKAVQEKMSGYLYHHVALLVIRNPCFA